MTLKVLQITAGNLFGGVENTLLTLAREKDDYRTLKRSYVLCFEGRLSCELRAVDVPPEMLGPTRVRHPWTVWRARRRLGALLKKDPVHAVICHMPWSLAIFGPVARRAKVPLVFWMHDTADGRHWVERWASLVKPDVIVCNSLFTAGTLPKLFPRQSVSHEVIHPPVSHREPVPTAEGRAALRAELGTPADACVIMQVSRMEPYKGHTLHLEALARLAKNPGWFCWMVGGAQRPHEANYLTALKARAEQAGIADRIRFLGERRDIPRLMAGADIFCQPNLRGEPFGIVFIEAMYARLPVVTTAIGGALEVVDETCGRLVPPDDPAALAEALRELISNPALREKLGEKGPARAYALSDPQLILEKLEAAVSRVATSSRRP